MFACLHAPGNAALLLECAGHFSPLIEETSSDTVVFDAHGLERLIGTPEQIAAAIKRRVGVEARLALASNPDAAMHAARGFPGTTIIPLGAEAATLDPLPLFLLGGSPDFARNLDLWGIRTFGEFAALPPLGVAARLGEEGAHFQRLACGKGQRQLRLRVDPIVFHAERELEDSLDILESLLFLLSQMLDDVCDHLRFYGRATNELRLRLKLERTADHTVTLSLPVPMLNARVLLKLLQLELNERPPQAPVERIYLELAPVEPRTAQHGLFLPTAPEPEKLEITLARIRGLVGVTNVGAPELLDTHRPDSFQLRSLTRPSSSHPKPSRDRQGAVPAPKLALRRFRPPHPAQVWCADHGKPVRVFSPVAGGPVTACAGPWHIAGDWWTPQAWDRQEWDVEISTTGVFRISQDSLQGTWRLDCYYD